MIFIAPVLLFRTNGKTVLSKRLALLNPSIGELLAELPGMSADDARFAIGAAHAAKEAWAGLTARARSMCCCVVELVPIYN
ncbi:hypothetical protein [Sinorhizobium meliloti]|uniref:hypothetical protein n=1 Tax=Rhizobium meliloti TaxID=382 RepID=UPI0010726792|nr:hypothetical protein [Sinorhizobium meliloti]MQW29636.1 hypothetical protein [Sinorhizobium meliloti]